MPDSLTPRETLLSYAAHDYTLPSAIASRAARAPERPFLVCEGRTWSWHETAVLVERTAQMLSARGIKRGDRVGVMARNSEKHFVLLAALARIRAIMVPTNPDFTVGEAGYVFEHAQVTAIACDKAVLPVAREACQARGVNAWFMALDDLTDLAQAAPSVELPHDVSPEDTCVIVYTSGTSGFPKGVMHGQRSYLLTGELFLQRMQLQPDERMLVVLPLFHINALFYSLSGAVAAGCTAIIAPRFSASGFWRLARESGATQVNVIEAMGTILASRSRAEYDPNHRIRKAYGVRPAAAAAFRNDFGVRDMVSGYGMTEIPGVLSPPFEGRNGRPTGIGLPGLHPADPTRPWTHCRVLDDDRHDVRVDEVGELAVKTPNVMQGYYRDEKQTAESFHEGWFLTGDLVRHDDEGYYFFVSRKKDIIRRRGENIAGAELDRVIGEHPGVREAAAVAVPSELGEDEILAAVVAKPGAKLTAEDIATWCAQRLAAIKVPRYVLFLDELPHTPTHKVAKNILKADPKLKSRAVDRLAATTET
jgi:carnitine-CoA ligase